MYTRKYKKPSAPGIRVCRICGVEKPFSAFHGGCGKCAECLKNIYRQKQREKCSAVGVVYLGDIPPGTCQHCGGIYPVKSFTMRTDGTLPKRCNPCKFQREDKEKRNKRRREKERTDPKTRVNKLMRNGIKKVLKSKRVNKNGHTWSSLVDYTTEDLVKHLKKSLRKLNKKSDKKYTWTDFMESRLHIDHITPTVKFSFSSIDDPEFKRCWSLDNLQLLPAKENISKGGKCEAFQIAF